MRDINGKHIADGTFVQWNGKDGLHVKISYAAGDGRSMEEAIVFRQRPELVQDQWQFREFQRGKPLRTFTVNLATGVATAEKMEDGELKRWNETLDIERGKTFAGFGFTLAAKALRQRLIHGETVELKAVGFTPQPRAVTVELSYAGRQTLRIAGRAIPADQYVVHAKLPALAKLFVKVPDAHIWLTEPPVGFARYQGALAEPDDQIVRIDVM